MKGGDAESFRILLVEDNPADADLIQEVLLEGAGDLQIHHVRGGAEALAFLARQPPYAKAETPHLVLLDLNLPKMDGREVLAAIKSDPELRVLPVLVLTSSDSPADIARAYALGANCYITKRIGLDGTRETLHAVREFWFSVAKIPG